MFLIPNKIQTLPLHSVPSRVIVIQKFVANRLCKMISDQLIVLCCIIGAGVLVFMGWAVTHRFYQQESRPIVEGLGQEFSQAQYMREVRLRNHDQIASMNGGRYALVFDDVPLFSY